MSEPGASTSQGAANAGDGTDSPSAPKAAASKDKDTQSCSRSGTKRRPQHHSTEVSLDSFSQTYDIKVANYRQAIKEEPSFLWTFTNPNQDPEEEDKDYQFRISLKLVDPTSLALPKHPLNAIQASSSSSSSAFGRDAVVHPNFNAFRPTTVVHYRDSRDPAGSFIHHGDAFNVQVRNVSKRAVKCAFTVKLYGEDGAVKESRREPSPNVRAHDAVYVSRGLGKVHKMLTSNGALLLQVGVEVVGGLVYESTSKRIRLDEVKKAMTGGHGRDATAFGSSSSSALAQELSKMLGDDNFNDVKLVCGSKTVPCSKFILCARSEVFKAMFSHRQMKEAQENVVTITDAEPDAVTDMVEFIYTDSVKDVCLERTMNLLPLSERYHIRSLSNFCRDALMTHLSVEHSSEIAAIAEQYELKDLKEKAMTFIFQHSSRVIQTEGWTTLLQTLPSLANEIIASLSKFREDAVASACGLGSVGGRDSGRRHQGAINVSWEDPEPNNPEEEVIPQFHINDLNVDEADNEFPF